MRSFCNNFKLQASALFTLAAQLCQHRISRIAGSGQGTPAAPPCASGFAPPWRQGRRGRTTTARELPKALGVPFSIGLEGLLPGRTSAPGVPLRGRQGRHWLVTNGQEWPKGSRRLRLSFQSFLSFRSFLSFLFLVCHAPWMAHGLGRDPGSGVKEMWRGGATSAALGALCGAQPGDRGDRGPEAKWQAPTGRAHLPRDFAGRSADPRRSRRCTPQELARPRPSRHPPLAGYVWALGVHGEGHGSGSILSPAHFID